MAIDDVTIASIPEMNVFIDTVADIREKKKNGYELWLEGGHGIGILPEHKDFVEGLKKGDKMLVVMKSAGYKLLYGPLKEENLYRF